MYLWEYEGFVGCDTELRGPFTLSTYKYWRGIQKALEQDLRQLGVTEYFAIIDSPLKYRWCKFLGFDTAYIVIGNQMEILFKEVA
jgi:hypothetical protein